MFDGMQFHHGSGRAFSWFAVIVRSRVEVRTASALQSKGYEVYLPLCKLAKGVRRPQPKALLPGYLFCRMDPVKRLPVLITPGVSGIVSVGGVPAAISDTEIDSVRKLVASGIQPSVYPYLPVGQRVRVSQGPLSGVEGVVVVVHDTVRLSVTIALLQRSISVEFDRSCVVPIEPVPLRALPHSHGLSSPAALRR